MRRFGFAVLQFESYFQVNLSIKTSLLVDRAY